MKTILVLTDFSSSARNASLYAVYLAREMKSKLLLFHSFQVDMPTDDIPVLTSSASEMEKKSEKILEEAAANIEKQYHVKAEVHAHAGFYPPEEILRLAKKLHLDLVVMGMKQKSKIAEVLAGSTVSEVMRNTKTPLMIVPENTEFMKPEKILLAFDTSSYSEPHTFSPLRKLSKAFRSEIYVVNVLGKENDSAKKKGNYLMLDRSLNGTKRIYCFPENKNRSNGVDTELAKHKAGMMAIVPHVQGFMQRIFEKSNTQDLAFQAHVPLLVLPASHTSNIEKK